MTPAEIDEAIAGHGYRPTCWAWGGNAVGTVDGEPVNCADCDRRERVPILGGDGAGRCYRCAFVAHLATCPIPSER